MIKTILKVLLVLIISLVSIISCTTKNNDFFTIDVNYAKEQPLKLSDIAEKIEAIDLEMTDSSLVNIGTIVRIHCTGEYIVLCQRRDIMIFDKTGKFIRKISSIGQGPGEYISAISLAVDIKNEYLYILCRSGKILWYDFDGNMIKESPVGYYYKGILNYIYHVNGHLLYLSEISEIVNNKRINMSFLYTIDDNLLISDSLKILKTPNDEIGGTLGGYFDYMCNDDENTYLFFGEVTSKSVVYDTLYQIKNNQIIPYLNLKFSNNGLNVVGEKEMLIFNMYKSQRYVFSIYNKNTTGVGYHFYYDIKTGKGYKFSGAFTDDVYTGAKVRIRPFDSNSNMFYYLHTNIDDTAKDEPNPTLYIGTLKK